MPLREEIRLFTLNKGYVESSRLFVDKVRLQRVAAELSKILPAKLDENLMSEPISGTLLGSPAG